MSEVSNRLVLQETFVSHVLTTLQSIVCSLSLVLHERDYPYRSMPVILSVPLMVVLTIHPNGNKQPF